MKYFRSYISPVLPYFKDPDYRERFEHSLKDVLGRDVDPSHLDYGYSYLEENLTEDQVRALTLEPLIKVDAR